MRNANASAYSMFFITCAHEMFQNNSFTVIFLGHCLLFSDYSVCIKNHVLCSVFKSVILFS